MFKFNLLSSSNKLINRQCLIKEYLKSLGKQQQNYLNKLNYSSVIKKSPNDFEVKESEDLNFSYHELNIPKDLKMDKLLNLSLKDKLEPISKPGSFISDLFLGKIDTDFLFYPKLVTNRKEYLQLNTQNVMINRFFRDLVCKDKNASLDLLRNYGFFNTWKLSMTEQCSIFESIGASMSNDILFNQLLKSKSDKIESSNLDEIFNSDYKNLFSKLILHNLVGSCLMFAGDKEIAIKYKNILDNGGKIGFAFNETQNRLGSLPFSDWLTEAKLSNDKKNWVIKGGKNKIFDDDYDHYIVFARTKDYPEDEKSNYKRKYEEPYDGVVCLLIDKKDIKISDDNLNNLDDPDFKYQKLELDYISVPRENELFEAEEYGCAALSCRGIGILLTSSHLLGILKNLQRQVYKFLANEKSILMDCKAVQGQLVKLTELIYTIESMNYLIAAMFDSFDLKKWPDMTLETSILKSFTTDQARQFLVKLQTFFGSKLIDVSKFHNLINLYDTLFDSSMHHRLFTASMGVHYIGVYKANDVIKANIPVVYPTFALLRKWRLRRQELDNPILDNDVAGHLHVKLLEEGEKLEYCLKRLEFASYLSIERFAKDINEQQMDLLLLSDIVTNVFSLTCVLSRASRSEIEGVQNSEYETFLARNAVKHTVHQVKFLVERIEDRSEEFDGNIYNEQVHKRNLKYDGYFPYSPIELTY